MRNEALRSFGQRTVILVHNFNGSETTLCVHLSGHVQVPVHSAAQVVFWYRPSR